MHAEDAINTLLSICQHAIFGVFLCCKFRQPFQGIQEFSAGQRCGEKYLNSWEIDTMNCELH